MNKALKEKLKTLPKSPGVYFHKSKNGEIIYVGKAAVLKNRVNQYFQTKRDIDIKTKALIAEITDTDWLETESEVDALFLEAEMVKRYMPRYNILLRDDKSLIYIRIDMKNEWPFVALTRNPSDDGAEYYGPYYNGFAVKKALRYLRRVFPYYTKPPKTDSRLDLDGHLGLSPVGMSSSQYKANLRKLIRYIKGSRKDIVIDLEKSMKQAAKEYNFEKASVIRNQLQNMRELQHRIMFGDKEFLDISKDEALNDLVDIFCLGKIPNRIEGYDVSHMSGVNVVASMVVFRNGVSDRAQYRKFKTHIDRNDDYRNMNETIARRFSEKNLNNWGTPDFVLIDGGKGQLDAAIKARDDRGNSSVAFIGLAKRDEQIIVKDINVNEKKIVDMGGYISKTDGFVTISLPKSSHVIKLLQRIRDESHRFAVSYHSTLKRIKQTANDLEDIPGIGSKTRSKLIRKFGSLSGLKNASENEIAMVVGPYKARLVTTKLL